MTKAEGQRQRANAATSVHAPRLRPIPAVAMAIGMFGAVMGAASLVSNHLEAWPVPILAAQCLALQALSLHAYALRGVWPKGLLGLSGLSLAAAVLLSLLPEYLTFMRVNGIIHRSLVSALLLLATSVPACASGLYYLLGATPRAADVSRYPLLMTPILLVLGAYLALLSMVAGSALPKLTWRDITTPYIDEVRQTLVWKDDWPVFQTETIRQAGMRTHLLGTGLLMALTSVIALPFGVGAGVYLAHYGESQAARLCRLAITTLRAMSVIILGMLGFSVVRLASGTFLQDVLCGYYYSVNGTKHGTSGSYLLASLVLSLLVIPVIARATEEGCRSLPAVLREGSLALGASEAYTLRRVTLPWAFPNIITALLLGCAEAAGSVAAIVLMAGTGAAGVGLFRGVTSLAYLVFRSRYSAGIYREMMGVYTYAAAFLVLLICIGLSTAALLLSRRFGERYRQR